MAAEDLDISPFELLKVGAEASESEIKTAYRKLSLKVHPDRNPNNPDAAQKFHELNQAYELLLDPLRRLALTTSLKAKEARKARFAKFDVKRKNLQEELEERERAFKKQKLDSVKEARKREQENERIKEEGRRMREEMQAEADRRYEKEIVTAEESRVSEEMEVPELGSLDTTVKLKYALADHSDLKTSTSLASLLSQFGVLDESSIVLSMKPPKKAPTKPPKFATALLPFKQIGDAFAAVCASGREDRGLKGVDVSWAEGQEPKIIGWLKGKGMLGTGSSSSSKGADGDTSPSSTPPTGKVAAFMENVKQSTSSQSSTFSSFPDSFATPHNAPTSKTTVPGGLDFESIVLMRLREAERAKLEQEIREQEAEG